MKYFVRWNVGYGDSWDVYDCNSEDEAQALAYDCWREEAESNAYYSAESLTQDHIDDYSLNEDLEG